MKKIFAGLVLGFIFSIILWAIFQHSKFQRSNDSVKNHLIVGTNAEYPPFSFIENDVIKGFDIDLAYEVVKHLGKTIQLKDMSFDILIPEIQRGSIDMIAAGMTPTPEREKEVLFTDLYFTGDPLVIISLAARPFKTIDELKEKLVIVNEGYSADFYLSAQPGMVLTRLPTPATALLTLESGRADAFVAARSATMSLFKQKDAKQFSVITIPNTEEKYAFAVSPHQKSLLPRINQILNELASNGFLSKLKLKWGLK